MGQQQGYAHGSSRSIPCCCCCTAGVQDERASQHLLHCSYITMACNTGAPFTVMPQFSVLCLIIECRCCGWIRVLGCALQGGETEALARLAQQLSDKDWVAAFEKPKGDPSAFLKPATTVLSPHLKFGCLSPRLFYQTLQKVQTRHPHPTAAHTTMWVSHALSMTLSRQC